MEKTDPGITIVYHEGCADGWCAAYVALRRYPEAQLIASGYDRAPPFDECRDRDVLVVDLSYPPDVLLELAKVCRSLRVYDHHRSFAEDLARAGGRVYLDELSEHGGTVVFHEARSGASITFAELFPLDAPHPLVRFAEDRDLWRFALRGSREIHAAVESHPRNVEAWDALWRRIDEGQDEAIAQLALEGAAILRSQIPLLEGMAEHTRAVVRCGQNLRVVNAPRGLRSELGDLLTGRYPGEIVAIWSVLGDGLVAVSARSRDGAALGLAREFGGGGHPDAAGFSVPFSVFARQFLRRAPTLVGAVGQAWDWHAKPPACVGQWLVHRPGAHPLWSHYLVSVVHLRPGAGLPAPAGPPATHELVLYALSPTLEPDPDQPPAGLLTPANLVVWLEDLSDREAGTLAEGLVGAIVSGAVNPDTDHRHCQEKWLTQAKTRLVKAN
jgi:oligoribonuclease NrnB/cAMP/cGMP phosphodiesterase (DHH superfamily)